MVVHLCQILLVAPVHCSIVKLSHLNARIEREIGERAHAVNSHYSRYFTKRLQDAPKPQLRRSATPREPSSMHASIIRPTVCATFDAYSTRGAGTPNRKRSPICEFIRGHSRVQMVAGEPQMQRSCELPCMLPRRLRCMCSCAPLSQWHAEPCVYIDWAAGRMVM